MTNRIDFFCERLAENDIQAALISSRANIRYLSGFAGDDSNLLVIGGKRCLITDGRYQTQAEQETQGWDVFVLKRGEKMSSAIGGILARENIRRIGIEKSDIRLAFYENIIDEAGGCIAGHGIDDILDAMRVIKDAAELEAIRRACNITDVIFDRVCSAGLKGKSEQQVAAMLNVFLVDAGGEDVAFPTIIASGPNGALPHAIPSSRVIQDGDLVTMDFGAVWGGYCADITRTVAVGYIDDVKRQRYEVVLEAQKAALQSISSGVFCREPDRIARSIIDGASLGEYFVHGLGHGVGLLVHEEPRLSRGTAENEILSPGMVVTVEPGIYIPGWGGIRIEDTLVVEKNGYSILTQSSKEIIILP